MTTPEEMSRFLTPEPPLADAAEVVAKSVEFASPEGNAYATVHLVEGGTIWISVNEHPFTLRVERGWPGDGPDPAAILSKRYP